MTAAFKFSPTTTRLLAQFGVEMAPGGLLVMADLNRAERCYVHDAYMPVAAAAFSSISPAFARGRFPGYGLGDLVWTRPSMDTTGAIALAEICGVIIQRPIWKNPEPFSDHLYELMERRCVGRFFFKHPRPRREGHYAIRPRAYSIVDESIMPEEMTAWRKDYRALPAPEQMLIASVLWLYRGGNDKTWMARLPKAWHAADALVALRAAGLIEDWAKLVALYPGW
jgi:hypothetical protein